MLLPLHLNLGTPPDDYETRLRDATYRRRYGALFPMLLAWLGMHWP